MLSEYSDSALNAHSDFYRFLYNRSRIKPLSEYFLSKAENVLTKTSVKYSKDILFKANKTTLISSKNVNNKQYLCSKAKEEEMAEEEKIFNWLVNCDGDSNDNVKSHTKHLCDEDIKSNVEEMNDYESKGFHKNRSVDNAVNEESEKRCPTKRETVGNEMSSTSVINFSNSKELIMQRTRENESKKIKSELFLRNTAEINDSKSMKILKDSSLERTHKQTTPSKKSGQRKISDFFQQIL